MRILEKIAGLPLTVKCAVQMPRLGRAVIRRHMQFHYDDSTQNGERWILSKVASQCRRFVDIGANLGDFSADFLSLVPGAEGVVFDPSGEAYGKLRARFSNQPSVRIVQKAISKFSGESVFFEEPDSGLSSSLSQTWSRNDARQTVVEVSTLDVELADCGGADYVKIDAEGHDLAVLRGASNLISKGAIRFLQFEYHTAWVHTGATLRAALDFLASFGYATYLIKGEGLFLPNYQAYGEYFSYSNYFAVCPAHHALLASSVRGQI